MKPIKPHTSNHVDDLLRYSMNLQDISKLEDLLQATVFLLTKTRASTALWMETSSCMPKQVFLKQKTVAGHGTPRT